MFRNILAATAVIWAATTVENEVAPSSPLSLSPHRAPAFIVRVVHARASGKRFGSFIHGRGSITDQTRAAARSVSSSEASAIGRLLATR
jgi:hypothetical protein